MGNRAVITTAPYDENNLGVYLHWNGGYESVKGFLDYCKMQDYRNPHYDCYGWAYLAGVLTNFFGDGLSCGIDICSKLDTHNGDNGTYLIDENWNIVERKFNGYPLETISENDLQAFIYYIDSRMPKHMQKLQEPKNDESEELKKGANEEMLIGHIIKATEEEVVRFENTAENIANFIMSNKMYPTTIYDNDQFIVASTVGGFLDTVTSPELREEVIREIIPLQMGEKDIKVMVVDQDTNIAVFGENPIEEDSDVANEEVLEEVKEADENGWNDPTIKPEERRKLILLVEKTENNENVCQYIVGEYIGNNYQMDDSEIALDNLTEDNLYEKWNKKYLPHGYYDTSKQMNEKRILHLLKIEEEKVISWKYLNL